jgi:4'-phosphopantetheinyl transferase
VRWERRRQGLLRRRVCTRVRHNARVPATASDAPTQPSAARLVEVVSFPLDVDAQHDELLELLDDRERARSRRILAERERRRFTVAHGVTRRVLGQRLRVPAQSITFTRRREGKPAVAGVTDLRFNLSHSDGCAVLALAHGREVGVDIERVRPLDVPTMARRFLSHDEADLLESLSGEQQLWRFFRCWTRKESVLKAAGVGLSQPLAGFDVGLREPSASAVVCHVPGIPTACWTVMDLSTMGGYVAAVAIAGRGLQLQYGLPPFN